MTGALHVVKLRRLWARFNDCLYSKVTHFSDITHTQETTTSTLREELEEWWSSLPSQLDFGQSNPLSVFASSEWFRLAYDHSILLLYRPFITASVDQEGKNRASYAGPNDSPNKDIIDNAFDECAKCAREMCLLYRRLYQSSSIQFTWGSLHIPFLGGLSYIY
ncbi:fungal specific transcription factor domain-containing protein [Aspergillus undulatus]|uniref:fungal specific transcription factor domain-containing protein n=1 Tax=Aspergillus undulatus TaxID=1810928 RepID=UPI003CCDA2BB